MFRRLLPTIVPRGTPDIGWADLAWSFVDCFRLDSSDACQHEVEAIWSPTGDALACLSVRSGLDLLLSAVAWPPGSEVLVSAITIPSILKILEAHRLVAIPLDVDPVTLSIHAHQIEQFCSPRTKAVLIAHLFGSQIALTDVAGVAQQRQLMVIEDCAQAYDGSDFRGHPEADVSMFSFGPIKTQTALGGAILTIRNRPLLAAMHCQQASHSRRSTWRHLQRILLFGGLKALARPLTFGAWVRLCHLCGFDYDAALSRLTRGFSGNKLLSQLRQQPPRAMLRLLASRLRAMNGNWIEDRTRLARTVTAILEGATPGQRARIHSHWVLPIISSDPDGLVRWLVERGYDATRKGSSLIAVPAPTGRPDSEPIQAQLLVERLVYLPLHPSLTDAGAIRLGALVSEFERNAAESSCTQPMLPMASAGRL